MAFRARLLLALLALAAATIVPVALLCERGQPNMPTSTARAAQIARAVKAVEGGKGVRAAAKEYGISRSTLSRHFCQYQSSSSGSDNATSDTPHVRTNGLHRMVFSPKEEAEMAQLILDWADTGYALMLVQMYALVLKAGQTLHPNSAVVKSWAQAGRPSPKWVKGFFSRHPELSRRMANPHDGKRRTVTKEVRACCALLCAVLGAPSGCAAAGCS